jgi:hypothetical protein
LAKFYDAKSGCYRPTPLKGILPPTIRHARKKLWLVYYEFFFCLRVNQNVIDENHNKLIHVLHKHLIMRYMK